MTKAEAEKGGRGERGAGGGGGEGSLLFVKLLKIMATAVTYESATL